MHIPKPWIGPVAIGFTCLLASGCTLVPERRLVDSQRRIQVLEAQLAEQRNEAESLRARNRQLAQRAVGDSQRLRHLEQAAREMDAQVAAFQNERAELLQAYQQLQNQVLARSKDPGLRTSSLATDTTPLASLAQAQSGCLFDPQRMVWSLPEDRLFRPDSSELSGSATLLLDALTRLLRQQDPPLTVRQLASLPAPSQEIVRTSASTQDSLTTLSQARLNTLRHALSQRLQIPESEIAIDVSRLATAEGDPSQTLISLQLQAVPSRSAREP